MLTYCKPSAFKQNTGYTTRGHGRGHRREGGRKGRRGAGAGTGTGTSAGMLIEAVYKHQAEAYVTAFK